MSAYRHTVSVVFKWLLLVVGFFANKIAKIRERGNGGCSRALFEGGHDIKILSHFSKLSSSSVFEGK